MCLHHGVSIYVQIVWCHSGHIFGPRVCCTTHEQIDIRGVAFPRGAPGGSCCSVEHQRVVIVSEGAIGAEALVQEAPLLPSSFQAADGRHTLHTARRERKQLFPLLFPRDEVPADGGGKKLPLCSAGLLTSNSREARNDAFLFVINCLCGPFLVRSSSRPVWVSFSGCQS